MKKTINLKKMTIAGAALLGLGTATVAIVNNQTQPTVVKASSSSSQNTLSQSAAIEKFQTKYNNAKISSISLEKENGNYVYEIEGFDNANEYSAEVNAQTGQISYAHSEKLDHDDHEIALDLNSVISRDEASSIAENKAGGTAQEWTLEQDGKTAYWEVKLSNGTEVKINANTKQIISTDKDDNDLDDNDHNENKMINKTNSSRDDHDDDDDEEDHDDHDDDDKDDHKNKSTHDHDDDDDDRDDDCDDDND